MAQTSKTFLWLFAVGFAWASHAQDKELSQIDNDSINVADTDNGGLLDSLAQDGPADANALQLKLHTDVDGNPMVVNKARKPQQNLRDLSDAAKFDSLWLKELSVRNDNFSKMYAAVTEQVPDSAYVYDLDTEVLKQRLAKLDEKTPFNIAYNPSLESVIKSFLVRKRGLMQRMLTASQFYFPMFEEALAKYDLPLEIKYLAIIESALNPRAKSRVGATGLWQFMYGTGKLYGLDVNSYVDERSDPIKSTEAACKYLSKLYAIFGDWDLVLAAYNSGPGNVNKAIRRSGGYTNYWNIRRNLPRETAGYLPAFLAVMYIFEYAPEHGLAINKVDRPYFMTDTIHTKRAITFDQISKILDVDKEDLETLNPSYKLDVVPKMEGKEYTLRLPVEHVGQFVANEDSIYNYAEKELKSREQPMPQLTQMDNRIRYKVRSGDYLGRIAERYHVYVSDIKRWNGLRSNDLRVGQRLTIFTRGPVAVATKTKATASSQSIPAGAKVHTVQAGDSLWTISQKYPGISVENLREWNGISGNNLQPGTKLKLCNCSS